MKIARTMIAAAAVATAVGFGPAMAADMPVKAPVAPPLSDWSGFYFGGHVGGAWSDVEWPPLVFFTAGGPYSFSPSAFAGGIHAGWNYQQGNWLVGIEASATWADLAEQITNGPVIVSTKTDWIATVVGRLGHVSNGWLWHLSGGYAAANMRSTVLVPGGIPGSVNIESGWTVGAGVEYKWTENLILGADYKYIDLGKTSKSGLSTFGFVIPINNIDAKHHIASLRLSYRFGAPLR